MSRKLASSAIHHDCAVPTTCQPPSSWCKDPWPATIRVISTGGLSLTLERRFERGSGLAIELPTEDGTATVLARVVEVRSHDGGGWLIGCNFISELSEEEVQRVLDLAPISEASLSAPAPFAPGAAPSLTDVLFQARIRRGEILRWFVKRLDVSGGWPLLKGKVMSLRIGGMRSTTPPLELSVRACRLFGSTWTIDVNLLAVPADEVLDLLGCPAI